MVPIPYAMSYRATATGQLPKLVACEGCGLEYVYLFQASAEGHGTSMLFLDNEGASERSRSAAAAQLSATLEAGCAVVPCPACGHVQQHMVLEARHQHHRWMIAVAFLALIVAGFLCFPAILFALLAASGDSGEGGTALAYWAAVGLLGSVAIGLPLLRGFLSRRYDPNREPLDARKRAGQEAAVTKEEFLKAAEGGTGPS